MGKAAAGACLLAGAAGIVASLAGASSRISMGGSLEERVVYNRDIQPILSKHCWPCHGPDAAILEKTGNMRLDSFKGATEDRGGYAAIVPGHPEKSKLIERVNAKEPMQMPPSGAPVPPLSAAQKQILEQWILEGAKFESHWAFVPPTMPPLPEVRKKGWVRNPIDNFVLARMEANGLSPAPEADRGTLIRRVSLALTGLPPTTQEVIDFENDKAPNAYERLVDRYLASPRYGENQARYWLDAVRYADTHGLHIDNERAIFPYRDWVVRAYNEDLPFDDFVKWQLGGDLYPEPTRDQMIASGYVRLNPTTAEGGVIEAEFLAKNTFDRTDTTATIFMGLTMGCAKCHDHKYDPISTRDYYSMYAFFNSTQDPVLDGNLKLHQPVMKAPSDAQEKELKRLRAAMDRIVSAVDLEAARKWLLANTLEPPMLGKWELSAGHEAKTFDEAFDQDFGPEPGGAETGVKWVPLNYAENSLRAGVVQKEIGAGYVRTTIQSKTGGEYVLRLGSDDGIKVWLNGTLVHANKVARPLAANQDTVKITLRPGANAVLVKIVNGGGNEGFSFGITDERGRRLSAAQKTLHDPAAKAEAKKSATETYLELGPEDELAKAYRKDLAAFRKLDEEIPYTYIAREMKKPRPTYVLKRGNYETPGERVDRNVPKVFGAWKEGRPKNRLGLAQWIVDPSNPLTARVQVNRVWQQHFGTGVVKSSEDFGVRGEWPSHPKLLDYLALTFIQNGWSLKKLHRLILTSAAYRQASATTPEKLEKDPENRLLAHGPRFRLDAEVVRDQALYLSGLLVEHPGGRGDKPYQPPGLWEAIAYPISDTARYVQDKGDALYRRSLYLFWKRTSPPPTMMIFDAPMRDACVVRRSRTNTPTQALTTLNETGFFEAARKMAERVLQTKPTDALRIDYAFRLATGRSPDAREAKVLLDLLTSRLAHYRSDPEAAKKLLTIGDAKPDASLDVSEVAAWALVCNAILNLDEVLTLH